MALASKKDKGRQEVLTTFLVILLRNNLKAGMTFNAAKIPELGPVMDTKYVLFKVVNPS